MLYAELGRFPLEVKIKMRMINYWISLKNGKETKLSNIAYLTLLNNCRTNKWLNKIRSILQDVGRNDLWLQSSFIEHFIAMQLKDQYSQQWNRSTQTSNKGTSYSTIKVFILYTKIYTYRY